MLKLEEFQSRNIETSKIIEKQEDDGEDIEPDTVLDTNEILDYLHNSMATFMEYIADDEHCKSSRIAISVWLKAIEKYQKKANDRKSQ